MQESPMIMIFSLLGAALGSLSTLVIGYLRGRASLQEAVNSQLQILLTGLEKQVNGLKADLEAEKAARLLDRQASQKAIAKLEAENASLRGELVEMRANRASTS